MWGDHENTLPLVVRILVQVRLYGERGRGGGETETGTTIIDEDSRASIILLLRLGLGY